MKRSRSPTPPLQPTTPALTLFELLPKRSASSRVPPSAFLVTNPSAQRPPGNAKTSLVKQAPPPPEQRSDSDVLETLLLFLDKEAPSLTVLANLYMVQKYMHLYQATVLTMMDLQFVCDFCDMTLVTALATALRVFNRKNINMTTGEGFEAVCAASVFLACGRYEYIHKLAGVRLRVRVNYEQDSPGSDKFDRANKITFPVLKDIGFTLAPAALHFLEAACRQCTPPEVTVAKAEELFRSLVQHFVRLTLFDSCYATYLPSEVCFGCAFAARQMLNFQADVTLTPLERFNMEQVRLACKEVTDDYNKDIQALSTSADMKKAFVIVQEHTKRVASEIHALLCTNCAAGAPSGSEPPT